MESQKNEDQNNPNNQNQEKLTSEKVQEESEPNDQQDIVQTDEQKAEETASNSIPDENRVILTQDLKKYVSLYNQVQGRDLMQSTMALFTVIQIKNKLNIPFSQELSVLGADLLGTQKQELFELTVTLFYKLKEQTSIYKIKEMIQIYHNLCMAEIFSKRIDSGDALMQEAMEFIIKHEADKSGLMISGLFRIRSKIYAERSQFIEQVKDLRKAVQILTDVKKEEYSDFNDKYIAQLIPEIVEIEMEQIKEFNLEQTEKDLLKSRALWKAREGEETQDFCHYKNTYLLLSLYFKKGDLTENQDLISEVKRNNDRLANKISQSKQYMSIFFRSTLLIEQIHNKSKIENNVSEPEQISEQKDP